MAFINLTALCTALVLTSSACIAQSCVATFQIMTEQDHGTLPSGTHLRGTMKYDEGEALRMGRETMSYLAMGQIIVSAPDGTQVTGDLRAIHLVLTPHFADYASFDAKKVVGNLGGVTDYEDPMLVTLFAPGGSLKSFELPKDTLGWRALSKRQVFQVHSPDTMWTLPGKISNFEAICD